SQSARALLRGALHADRADGPVLALRGHRLALPAAAPLLSGDRGDLSMSGRVTSDGRVPEREREEPMNSVLALILVGAALLLLTLLTVELAKVDLGLFNTPIALFIAALKASLVVAFFMHGRFAPPLIRVVMFGSLLWLGFILVGTTDDFVTRFWNQVPGH